MAIFATPGSDAPVPEAVFTIFPYRHDSAWVFDDDRVGLVKEPFVSGIDLIRDEHDQPLLAELELVEPSLFLRQEPAALKRLVRGIAARL